MQPQTDFRAQLHGFDFDNNWDTDDAYRNFVKQKLEDAVPIVVKIIVTNPAFGGALLGALGAAYGIGEALLPGIFDSIIIPAIINQIVGEVNDNIGLFLPDSYGACGGIAFASLDYYYNQWVVPKGVYNHPDDAQFNVPPRNLPDANTLRLFIFQRLEDTYDEGGVMNKMLEWYIIFKTLPPQVGGGGVEIQSRTKSEWVILKSLLDQGKPQPIALLFDVWNIFENHQLVAYGYSGDPNSSTAIINIYDNRFPNRELMIQFDFTGSEMLGNIMPVGNPQQVIQGDLKGFFCVQYIPAVPPIAWGLAQGMNISPSLRQGINMNFDITGEAKNGFSFFQPFQFSKDLLTSNPLTNFRGLTPIESVVEPAVNDALNFINSVRIDHFSESDAFRNVVLPFEEEISFGRAGYDVVFAKIYLSIRDLNTHLVLPDFWGVQLSRIFYLPAFNVDAVNHLQLNILPALNIEAYNPDAVACFFPWIEGTNVTLLAISNPFTGANVQYEWFADNIVIGTTTSPKFELFDLPAAGTMFVIKVVITNTDDGSQASGSLNITTYTQNDASLSRLGCELYQLLQHLLESGLINPFGPEDKEFLTNVAQNIHQVANIAKQIVQISKDWEKLSL